MAQGIGIYQLPEADTLTGDESIPIDSGSDTKRATVAKVREGLLAEDGDASQTVVKGRTLDARAADVVNVLDAPYGAKADGVTNDMAALQAAFDAASAVKGTVILPPGELKVSGTLTISAEITVRAHAFGTRIRTTSATAPVFRITGVGNAPGATIECITFASSVTRTAGGYIEVNGAHGTTIRGCRAENPYDGIVVTGPVIQNLLVRDCIMDGVKHHGVHIDVAVDTGGPALQGIVASAIDGLLVTGTPTQDAVAGLYVTSAGDLTVNRMVTIYCATGLAAPPRSAAVTGKAFKETIQLLSVGDSSFDTGSNCAIALGGSGEIRNVILNNVWAASSGVHGVALQGTGAIHHVSMIGVTSCGNTGAGLAVENPATGTVSVIGGCYAGNSGSGVGSGAGLLVLSGCHLGSTDPAGVAFGPNGGFGLYVYGSASYAVSGVTFGANTAGNFYDGSTGSTKSIVGSPGTGKTLYTNGPLSITAPAGQAWTFGQVATTAHAAGNVGSVSLTIQDGASAAGVFVKNTHDGTFSSQSVEIRTAWGGVVGTTTRFTVEKDGAISNGSATLFSAAGIVRLRPYTVATLPSASPAYQQVAVSDRSSRPATSDGTSWRWADGTAVS